MRDALKPLLSGEDLSFESARSVFEALVQGQLSETEITALLVALKVKGERPEELAGAANALWAAGKAFPAPDYLFADSCGTGGDGLGTVNISTAVAFCAAAAGLPIAKHGNRSVSSKCGSADVLAALGANLDASPEVSRRALDEAGVCFLFAPHYHPGVRHAMPVRRALKVRTVMNALGPLINPARPKVQMVGVYSPALLLPVAHTLERLGVSRALVVHGDGLDEVALHGETQAAQLMDGTVRSLTIHPGDAGLPEAPIEALAGGEPQENAAWLQGLLSGQGAPAHQHAVALNAGALLWTAGLFDGLSDAVARALSLLQEGAPRVNLDRFIEVSLG